jgi:hypothetical protein
LDWTIDDIKNRKQADDYLGRGVGKGTPRLFTVYSELDVMELPSLTELKKSLLNYHVDVRLLDDPQFYKVRISYGSDTETVLLDARLEDVWELAYVSSKPIRQSLAVRFFALLYPYVAKIHLKSNYLTKLVDLLQERYRVRPIMTKVVARQFFDIKRGETIVPKKTLVLYQEDCEPTLKALQRNFTVWPSLLELQVSDSEKFAYAASFRRDGVSKFGAGEYPLFREDVFEFITTEARRQRAEFSGRAPSLADPEKELSPVVMESEAPLTNLMPGLRDGLLKQYHCAVVHNSNPYLDMRVVDTRSGSVFQVIASGSTLAVVPITYKTPVAFLKLTRLVSDLVGVESAM